jgi:branched-chain amino acid transport system permease protein
VGAVVGTVSIEFFRQQLAIGGSEFAIVVVGIALLLAILVLPDGAVPRFHAFYVSYVGEAGSQRDDAPDRDDGGTGVPE